MILRFLPVETNFFDLFDKQIGYAVDAAVLFKRLVTTGDINEESISKMHDIEHQGDDVAHTIIAQLNKTFITPFDREDIHMLAKEIDDIIDMLFTITRRLKVYKLIKPNDNLIEFAAVIEQSVNTVACAVNAMRGNKNHSSVSKYCVEVNRLENVGDTMRDVMLAQLFDREKDPIAVIKWKEIYQDAETVLDICEDVAHMVESIQVKQA